MIIPDWLNAIFVKLGLKETEEQKIVKQIAVQEESRRTLNQELDRLIHKINNLEAEIKVLRPKYEAAHGAEKNMIAAKIKPLIQQLGDMQEKESQISLNIKNITSIIHNMEMQRQQLKNPDIIEQLEESIDAKKDIISDTKEQRRVSDKLDSLKLQDDDKSELDMNMDTEADSNADIDSFFSSMDGDKEKVQEEA